jgi:dihydrofolate reductase
MRKIKVAAFVSLDGIMQAPGGPDEDRSNGFELGGWLVPHFDESVGAAVDRLMREPFDLLLGRRTYDIFAGYWPAEAKNGSAMGQLFDRITKFVATRNPEADLGWQNTRALGSDPIATLRDIKAGDGPDLVTQGSSDFLQTLLRSGLVDELTTMTFPVILGTGKRLFTEPAPTALKLIDSSTTGTGVVISRYEAGGRVTTGSVMQ